MNLRAEIKLEGEWCPVTILKILENCNILFVGQDGILRNQYLGDENFRVLDQERKWRPMAEAPRTQTEVLVMSRTGHPWTAHWNTNAQRWQTDDDEITHIDSDLLGWLPIPKFDLEANPCSS